MPKKIDPRVRKGAELAHRAMRKLQVIFAVLLSIAFAAAVSGLAAGFFSKIIPVSGPAQLIAFLSTVLMVSLVGSVAGEILKENRELRPQLFIGLALVGSTIGVLEDWLGPASVSGSPNAEISVALSLVLLALLIALSVTASKKS
ncbi:hypothetical protein GKQ38_03730 [Candidatus Nanohaloarchaea archaeon]|nr:hypothetical protein GKQ38_03730 [Candidatus Nanohaloarchaea archaeon]